MDIDDDVPPAFAERSRAAAEMLERSLMKAVGSVEAELARVVRAGETDIERLAGLVVEIVARLGAAAPSGGSAPDGAKAQGSLNQVATAIARAVRRGARFS